MEQKDNNTSHEGLTELSQEELEIIAGGGDGQIGPFDYSGLSTGERVLTGGAVAVAALTLVGGAGRKIYKAGKFMKKK